MRGVSTNYPLALVACKRLLTTTLVYTMHSFDLTMYQVMRERVNKQTVMNWFIFIICSFNVIFYIITKNDVQHGKNLCLYNFKQVVYRSKHIFQGGLRFACSFFVSDTEWCAKYIVCERQSLALSFCTQTRYFIHTVHKSVQYNSSWLVDWTLTS